MIAQATSWGRFLVPSWTKLEARATVARMCPGILPDLYTWEKEVEDTSMLLRKPEDKVPSSEKSSPSELRLLRARRVSLSIIYIPPMWILKHIPQ